MPFVSALTYDHLPLDLVPLEVDTLPPLHLTDRQSHTFHWPSWCRWHIRLPTLVGDSRWLPDMGPFDGGLLPVVPSKYIWLVLTPITFSCYSISFRRPYLHSWCIRYLFIHYIVTDLHKWSFLIPFLTWNTVWVFLCELGDIPFHSIYDLLHILPHLTVTDYSDWGYLFMGHMGCSPYWRYGESYVGYTLPLDFDHGWPWCLSYCDTSGVFITICYIHSLDPILAGATFDTVMEGTTPARSRACLGVTMQEMLPGCWGCSAVPPGGWSGRGWGRSGRRRWEAVWRKTPMPGEMWWPGGDQWRN